MSQIQVPKGWEKTKLGDVCDIKYGYTSKSNTDSSGIAYLRITDIDDDRSLKKENRVYVSISKENFEKYKLELGDMVIARSGSVGRSLLFESKEPFVFASYLIRFRPNMQKIIPKFLFYLCNSQRYWNHISSFKTVGSIPNVNATNLSAFTFFLPDILTQQNIVKKLDYILEQLEEKKKMILELQNKKTTLLFSKNYQRKGKNFVPNLLRSLQNSILKSVYEQTFDNTSNQKRHEYGSASISDTCDLISGQHILHENYNLDNRGIPYLTGPDDFGELHPSITKWTDKPKAIAKKNDILVTVKGAGVGKINILGVKEAAISRQLMAIRPRNCNYEYLYYFLLLNYDKIKQTGIGTTVPGIDRQSILQISFPFPPLEIQERYVKMIKEKMKMLDVFTNHLPSILDRYDLIREHLEYLSSAILDQAFSGKLVN